MQAALDKATTGRTTITIAHRLSTVRNADNIVVFDKGEIVERGTHDELMQKENGFYRKLVSSQEIESLFEGEKLHEEASSPRRHRLRSSQAESSSLSASIRSLILGDDDEEDGATSEIAELLKKEGAKPASMCQIFKYAKPEAGLATLGFIISLIRGASWPCFAVVYGALFNVFSHKTDPDAQNKITWITIAFMGIGVVGGVTTWLSGYVLGLVGEKVNVRLRMDVYKVSFWLDF